MFCTSRPLAKRQRRTSTREEMAEAVRAQIQLNGCVQKDDLIRAGFTPAEIETYGQSAVADVRKASVRDADRPLTLDA